MKPSETRKKCPYVERDISWMYFNQRILLEAARPEVPLLERLTFLGIYSNNLDEFFRVRVATLNRIIEYDDKNTIAKTSVSGDECRKTVRNQRKKPDESVDFDFDNPERNSWREPHGRSGPVYRR